MAGLHLTRTDENTAEIDALAAALAADGGGRVGIDGMFSDLPGRLRRTFAPHPRLLGLKVSQAWTWEAHDRRDPEWWPQGITTSARTGFDARHGYDVFINLPHQHSLVYQRSFVGAEACCHCQRSKSKQPRQE